MHPVAAALSSELLVVLAIIISAVAIVGICG